MEECKWRPLGKIENKKIMFAPYKVIQDSLGFWDPRYGFWDSLPVELGFRIPDYHIYGARGSITGDNFVKGG